MIEHVWTMHPDAKQWDQENYVCKLTKRIPHNRPCDRCGVLVTEGYIHQKCLREELEEMRRERSYLRRLGTQLSPCDQG